MVISFISPGLNVTEQRGHKRPVGRRIPQDRPVGPCSPIISYGSFMHVHFTFTCTLVCKREKGKETKKVHVHVRARMCAATC